jgi:carboxylesterase type B
LHNSYQSKRYEIFTQESDCNDISFKVTIFGESAGAMSVMFHYLSPQTKIADSSSPQGRGLFRAAIAQSGVASSTLLKLDKNPIYYARCLKEKLFMKLKVLKSF